MNKLVSVIVPVYNSENYLKRCVESILRQTYTDLQIILVDDGSSDRSLSICNEFAMKDERVLVVNQSNQGVSSARNRGLTETRGDYILFVDSDDYLIEDCVEKLVDAVVDGEDAVIICGYLIRDENSNIVESGEQPSNKTTDDIYDFFYNILVSRNILGSVWRTLFPVNIIKKYNIAFPKCALAEDQIFILNTVTKTENIKFIKDNLYVYYLNSKSSTHQKYKVNFLQDRQIYFQNILDIIKNCDFDKNQKNELIGHVILRERKNLFFNAAFAVDPKKEYKELKKSIFYKYKVDRKIELDWWSRLTLIDKIVACLMRFHMIHLMSIIRHIRNQ